MTIWYAPYSLRPRAALNSRSVAVDRQGALIRVETSEGEGFADLHPWTEFGDASLEDQLRSLASGSPLPLAARSMAIAAIDAKARAENRNVFRGLEIPPSHFLITNLFESGRDRLEALVLDGYKHVKFKVGRDPDRELEWFEHIAEDWPEELVLRLDFNSSLDADRAHSFFDRFPRALLHRLEFVEDPTPFDPAAWKSLAAKAPLALDLESSALTGREAAAESFQVVVLKPVKEDPDSWTKHKTSSFVVSSYMDHPLGQAFAASEAGRLHQTGVRVLTCGLLSHVAYEPTDFSEAIRAEGPRWLSVDGTGLGFDDLLRRQEWRKLTP